MESITETSVYMQSPVKISHQAQELLRCPICHAKLKRVGQEFECQRPECSTTFPILDGVPVLLNEKSSLFTIDDFVSHRNTFFSDVDKGKLNKILRRLKPTISRNISARQNYRRLSELLLRQSASPRVLVLGGSRLGSGMEAIAYTPSIEWVATDVSFGPLVTLICDAHDIPFEDQSFDGVIAQAVLEHVVDPYRCTEEVHRVLKKQGIVYAETPFMQQVHGRQYDFTRFTHLGHRRLFRRFEEIKSGAVCGPGMAFAWSYQYFLMSFATSKTLRTCLRGFANLTSFYLTYLDYFLIEKPGTLDAASACYFMGRKSVDTLSDRELLKLYKGAG
jgi:uncharacterized protein YbaR (Trm112 family)/SAM-dependent methyltransferase